MKKICFFSGDITRSGGTERVSVIIANELVKQEEYDICFLSLCEQRSAPFFAIDERINRYTLGDKWIKPGPGYVKLIPKLRRFLKKHNVDLIIDIDIVLDVLSIPAVIGKKTRVISWEHFNCDYEMSIAYRRWIARLSAKFSDYIITLTAGDCIRYGQLTGRTQNIEAIHNPMNDKEIILSEQKEKLIITAVRLVHDKGIDYLATIAPTILKKYPDWKWFVLGEGEDRELLEKTIQEKGLQEKLIAPGLVDCVETYLSKASMFVLTSRVEGLPMCLLEAKTYQLPCVSFDIPTGPNEIIEEGISGYLIEPFDCEKMISRISELIENETLRNSFAENAGNNIHKFKLESIMEKWNRVLSSLCE